MNELLPELRRGRIKELDVFDVTDAELKLLENGSNSSVTLNFAVFWLSSALTLFVTLLSADLKYEWAKYVFPSAMIVGFVMGMYFVIRWKGEGNSVSGVIKTIRDRLPKPGKGIQELPPEIPEGARLYQVYRTVDSIPSINELKVMKEYFQFDFGDEPKQSNKTDYWTKLQYHVEAIVPE